MQETFQLEFLVKFMKNYSCTSTSKYRSTYLSSDFHLFLLDDVVDAIAATTISKLNQNSHFMVILVQIVGMVSSVKLGRTHKLSGKSQHVAYHKPTCALCVCGSCVGVR